MLIKQYLFSRLFTSYEYTTLFNGVKQVVRNYKYTQLFNTHVDYIVLVFCDLKDGIELVVLFGIVGSRQRAQAHKN